MNNEKTLILFAFVIVLGVFAMSLLHLYQRQDCKQTAMAQNYPADAVKKICR
jgi:hypothetical protein